MIEPMAARQIAESEDARPVLETLHQRNDAARAYWTRHLTAVGATLLGPDADAVVDLPD